MLKKRLIFVLYFLDGQFCLSRNFRLQKAGDVNWLLKRFRFATIGRQIDELVLLDVSRTNFEAPFSAGFWEATQAIMRTTFTPLTVGGGIRSMDAIGPCFDNGADKVILNTALHSDPAFVQACVARYGAQAVVAGIDVRRSPEGFLSYTENGATLSTSLADAIALATQLGVGEIFVNSIDQDGTGTGYELDILPYLENLPMPVIVAGGAGKPEHISSVLSDPRASAAATGNLFNFIGDGFGKVRTHLIDCGLPVRR